MNDPYEVLGIDLTADEGAIRSRYLELVRQFPPDREPERFAAVREAYDQLRDPIVNLENRLFSSMAPFTLDSILAESRPDIRKTRLSTSLLLSLGRP